MAVYGKTSDGILTTERPRSVLIIFRRRKMECRSHRRQVDERVGLHLLHYPASVGFHRDLADAELKPTCLFNCPVTTKAMTSRSRRLSDA